MFKVRKDLMQELGKPRAAHLRRAQAESLRRQGFQVNELTEASELFVTDKAGGRLKISSLPDGIAVTSGENRTHLLKVDGSGRLASITDPAGNRTRFAHDSRGRLIGLSTAPDRIHRLDYDESNRVTSIHFPDQTKTRFAYDFAGNLTQVLDRNGREARYSYYPTGHLAQVTDWQGNVTSYGYSSANEPPTTVVLPNGNRRDWMHDAESGRYKLFINGVEHLEAYASRGKKDTYEVSCKDGTRARYVIRNERIVEAANESCTVKFEYDDQGRVLKEACDGKVVEYVRNPAGALIGLITPDGGRLTFQRDTEQRVSSISDWSGGNLRFSYAPSGALQAIEYPNGTSSQFTSNAVGLPESMRVMAGASVLAEYQWESDVRDRVATMAFHGERHSYSYDAEGRLVAEDNVVYQLDANGNRVTDSAGQATFDAANQIVSWAGQKFQHDARGNMTLGVCSKGAAQFTYDGLDRLKAVKTGGIEAKYFYDALGRRVRKEVGGRVTTFVWAGEQLLSETTTEHGISSRTDYLQFPDLKLPLAMRINGTVHFLHTGRRAEPLCMTGPQGEVLWQARYSAFGSARIDVAKQAQPFRLAGQYFDEETGLCYVLARYYNPQLGRFLIPDPQGFAGGSLNLYTYCDGDPVNKIDPTGEFAFLAIVGIIAVGAVIGAAIGAGMEAWKQHKEHPDKPLDWGAIGKEAGKGAIVGAVGTGVGLLLAPLVPEAGAGLLAVAGGGAVVGGVSAGIEQCVNNALHDKPLLDGLGPAIGVGAVIGAVTAGVGAIWANRARRAAQAAREAEIAAQRARAAQRLFAQQRQAAMLEKDIGYNISPTAWDKYPTIGRNGTFLTDEQAVTDIIGPIKGQESKVTITPDQQATLEKAMGLEPGSLANGFKVREVTGITNMAPRSPLEGNRFFLGPGEHLPGGGPEMVVNSIPTTDGAGVKTILEVTVKP